MNTTTTKMGFPAAPGSAATISLLALTGQAASTAKRISIMLKASAASGTLGLDFTALLDGGTTYRSWTSYTHPSTTETVYLVAVPLGVVGIKVQYTNSAAVLTVWEGSSGVEGASP
jgi:hypothetical protein